MRRKFKLFCALGLGFSSLAALAAPPSAAQLLAARSAAAPKAPGQLGALPNLPLPPVHLGSSMTVPAFGKAQKPMSDTAPLPGLGNASGSYTNPGEGNGYARFSDQLNIDPQSKQIPTSATAAYTEPRKGQWVSDYKLQTPGAGPASDPVSKTTNSPLGTFSTYYHNNGQGKTFNSEMKYVSPPPKK